MLYIPYRVCVVPRMYKEEHVNPIDYNFVKTYNLTNVTILRRFSAGWTAFIVLVCVCVQIVVVGCSWRSICFRSRVA